MDLPRFFNRKHDVILFYAKTKSARFLMPKTPWTREDIIKTRKQKIHVDEHGNERIWMPGGKGKSKSRLKKLSDIMKEGKAISDVWRMPIISSSSKERTGYPTQKPLALYERIICASSNEGDVVLDPFAGCATTCVAAERLGRQWVGIDIWDKARETVIARLQKEGLAADGDSGDALPFEDVHYVTEPPERTDDGETSAPFLRVKEAVREPDGPKMSRAEMFAVLLSHQGIKCQGCDRKFDDRAIWSLTTTRRAPTAGSTTYRTAFCSAARATVPRATSTP